MGAPIFGYKPRSAEPSEVFEDCVAEYATSESRTFIWDGVKQILERTCLHHPEEAVLHIDSEFVEITRDPTHAALVLEAQKLNRELLSLWENDNRTDWMVETYLIPPRPTNGDAETLAAWETMRKETMADLSANGTKGYPILELHACRTYTKS